MAMKAQPVGVHRKRADGHRSKPGEGKTASPARKFDIWWDGPDKVQHPIGTTVMHGNPPGKWMPHTLGGVHPEEPFQRHGDAMGWLLERHREMTAVVAEPPAAESEPPAAPHPETHREGGHFQETEEVRIVPLAPGQELPGDPIPPAPRHALPEPAEEVPGVPFRPPEVPPGPQAEIDDPFGDGAFPVTRPDDDRHPVT